IEDEDNTGEEARQIVAMGNGIYEDSGAIEIGKIEKIFGTDIMTDDFTTVAGLVIAEKGSGPRQGEQVKFRGLEYEVTEADEKRILRVRIKRAGEKETEEIAANR